MNVISGDPGEQTHIPLVREDKRRWVSARSTAMLQKHLRKFNSEAEGELGGAMVELALTLPILLLIVTCIFSFGIAMNNYLELTDATAIGSRLLAISRNQTTDPCAAAATAIYAAAPYLKPGSLSFTFTFNGVSYSGNTCSSGSYSTGAAGNMTAGSTAQVTVTYPCNITVYGHNYAPSCNLVASTTELVQ